MDDTRPVGFAATDAVKGERVRILRIGLRTLGETDAAADEALARQLLQWVAPEISARTERGDWQPGTKVSQAAIIWKSTQEMSILLNAEVGWQGRVRPRTAEMVHVGADVLAQDIDSIEQLCPTGVDEDDRFLILFLAAGAYRVAYDFLPGQPLDDGLDAGQLRGELLRQCRDLFIEHWFGQCFQVEAQTTQTMLDDGWFRALCLLPQPYMAMVDAYRAGNPDGATHAAQSYLTEERILGLRDAWLVCPFFREHSSAINEGIQTYLENKPTAAARTLLPCLEGIIRAHWRNAGIQIPYSFHPRLPSYIQGVGQQAASGMDLPVLVLDDFVDYFREYLLHSFDPNAPDPESAVGRHALLHGQRTSATTRDALQVIVALDSLYRAIVDRRVPVEHADRT